MSMILHGSPRKLIIKILSAVSRGEVMSVIDEALKEMHRQKTNGFSVLHFIDKMREELSSFNAMDKSVNEWSNITMAKMYLSQIRRRMETTPFYKN